MSYPREGGGAGYYAELSNARIPNNAEESEYFSPDSIFLLAGHGYYNPGPRYALKQNEFYSSVATCGESTFVNDLDFLLFGLYNQQIKIPKSNSDTFYTLNYPNSPFIESRVANILFSTHEPSPQNIKIVKHGYKMYVPFSKSKKTHTITNDFYRFISDMDIKQQMLVIKNFQDKTQAIKLDVPDSFNFGGMEYKRDDFGEFQLREISISGVLHSAMSLTEEFIEQITDLKKKSDEIESIFLDKPIKKKPIIFGQSSKYGGYDPKAFTLNILLSEYSFNSNFFTDYSQSDPLLEYNKQAVLILSSLSYYPLEKFLENGLNSTFLDVYQATRKISEIYKYIQSTRKGNKPIIIINPLCRNYFGSNVNTRIEESNEETDPLSVHPAGPRYARMRNKTRKNVANCKSHLTKKNKIRCAWRKGLKQRFRYSRKQNLNANKIANFTNLKNINANNWQKQINSLPEGYVEDMNNSVFNFPSVNFNNNVATLVPNEPPVAINEATLVPKSK